MSFKKVITDTQYGGLSLKKGDIVTQHYGQYYIVATPTTKTRFIGYYIPITNKEIFTDLKTFELVKIAPHILKRSIFC